MESYYILYPQDVSLRALTRGDPSYAIREADYNGITRTSFLTPLTMSHRDQIKLYIPTEKPTSADLSIRVSARVTVSYLVNVYSPSQLSCSQIRGAKSIPVK